MTRGPVETAICARISSGTVLTTPARGARFSVATIDDNGVVLLLGARETPTRLRWEVLEGVAHLLAGGAWTPIGSSYSTEATPGTLDAFLKSHVNRATAGWVAALLETAGVVEIDRTPPTRVRAKPGGDRAPGQAPPHPR